MSTILMQVQQASLGTWVSLNIIIVLSVVCLFIAESQFARFTETQSNISGVISAMWSYSMIPTVNSFTDQVTMCISNEPLLTV